MALSLAVTATLTERTLTQLIEAVFAAQPGNTILTSLAKAADAGDINAVAQAVVNYAEPTTAEAFAASIMTNLDITERNGVSAENVSGANDYIIAQLNTAGKDAWGATTLELVTLFSGLTTDDRYATAATKFNESVNTSLDYSLVSANTEINWQAKNLDGATFNLKTIMDTPDNMGTSGADIFIAKVIDNANTFQSGDSLDGGAGIDALYAEVGSSQNFAISAETKSIENFFIDARSDSRDSNDNNLQNNFVQIDAGNIVGEKQWWTNGSRADVVIEDIRIEDNEKTKDITFGMRDTDPGSNALSDSNSFFDSNSDTDVGASLHAYFDANSLRTTSQTSSGILNLQVIDGENATAAKPLENSYNNAFGFKVGDTLYYAASADIKTATTYEELLAAVQKAITETTADYDAGGTIFKGTAAVADSFTVSLTDTFTVSNAEGTSVTGQTITLTTDPEMLPGNVSSSGWLSTDNSLTPPNTNMTYKMSELQPVSTENLITSQVIVDNVGRGSEGGDLEIGTMSTRGGVEQFDVTVEDSSWLTNMRSTNEALQVVNITSAAASVLDETVKTGAISTGSLYIGSGMRRQHDENTAVGRLNNNLTGLRTEETHLNTNGLVDVQTVDASTFTGELKLGASLTYQSVDKYLTAIDNDRLGTESADNLAFNYTLGQNNDFLNMSVNHDLTADSDFSLTINGGAGADNVQLDLVDSLSGGSNNASWYAAQKANANITINTGAGDDVVETLGEGDVVINTGAGNDVIYTDNTGALENTSVREVQVLTFGDAGDLDPQGQVTVTLSDGQSVTTTGVKTGDTGSSVAAAVKAALLVNPFSNVNVTQAGDAIILTYLPGYHTGSTADVANATITDLSTDVTLEVVDTTVGTTTEVPAVTEKGTVQFVGATATAGQTLEFSDGTATKTVTLVDTDGNGNVDAFEVTQQVGAATFTKWDITNVNPSVDTITVGAKTAGPIADFSITGGTAVNVIAANLTSYTQGVAAVTETGVNAVQTITITNGVDHEGTITVTAAGSLPAKTINLSVGNEANVAAQIASALNGVSGISAKQGTAAGSLNKVIVTFDTFGNAPLITLSDGALVSSSVVEQTKGVDSITVVSTDIDSVLTVKGRADIAGTKAVWTANNSNNTNRIDQLDTAAVTRFSGIKGQLRVEFTPEMKNSAEVAGQTSAWVNIDWNADTMTTDVMAIRQAIKTAIADDNELSKLLVAKDGPNATFIVESLIDGVMEASDLDIQFRATEVTATDTTKAQNADNGGTASFDAAVAHDAYAVFFAQDTQGFNLIGEQSTAGSSDNTVNAGSGDDVIVLSTDANSNETVVFTDNFDKTTVVYFDENDSLDFTAYLDATDSVNDNDTAADTAITVAQNSSVLNVTNEINIVDTIVGVTAGNAAMVGLFLDVHQNDSHVADVYTATSAAGSTAVSTNLVGVIDLTDININTLTVNDFTAL